MIFDELDWSSIEFEVKYEFIVYANENVMLE